MQQDTQSDHSDIALYCIYYAVYLTKLKEYSKAKKYLLKSREIYRNIYSADHRAVASLLTRLSLVTLALGNESGALAYLHESLEIKSSLYGTKHPLLGRDLNRLACLLSARKDYPNAIVYHIAAIQAFQASLGDNHIETIVAYGNLGITLLSDGDTKRGMNILHTILYRLLNTDIPLCHLWIQRFNAYFEKFNHATQTPSSPRDDRLLELISLENLSASTIIFPFFSSLDLHLISSYVPSSSSSLSYNSSPHSLLHSSPVTVIDPEPSQNLEYYRQLHTIHSSQRRTIIPIPEKSSMNEISDENRLPYAALVLTE